MKSDWPEKASSSDFLQIEKGCRIGQKRPWQRRLFQEQQVQVFREWAMALLSPPPHDDQHGDNGRHHHGDVNGRGYHAGHHNDNGPSPPPPHSKLSFLLFDFTFGQKSSTAQQTHSLLLNSNEWTRKGVGWERVAHHGDLQIPLWQLPRPQSLSSRHSRRVRSALATTQAS